MWREEFISIFSSLVAHFGKHKPQLLSLINGIWNSWTAYFGTEFSAHFCSHGPSSEQTQSTRASIYINQPGCSQTTRAVTWNPRRDRVPHKHVFQVWDYCALWVLKNREEHFGAGEEVIVEQNRNIFKRLSFKSHSFRLGFQVSHLSHATAVEVAVLVLLP